MNLKNQMTHCGVVLLVALVVAPAPTLAAEPIQVSVASGPQTSLLAPRPTTPRPVSGASLQTLWSTSNQFGTGQAWIEHTRAGILVSQTSFTSVNGKTLNSTVTRGHIRMVTGAGSIDFRRLANGHWIEAVFVRPGACENEPSGRHTAKALVASIELNAHGKPVDWWQQDKFSTAKKAFACGSVAVRRDMRSSMVQAGVLNASGSAMSPAALSGIVMLGPIHTDVTGACMKAAAELAGAYAGLVGALAAGIPSDGMATFLLGLAYGEYVDALSNYQAACGGS